MGSIRVLRNVIIGYLSSSRKYDERRSLSRCALFVVKLETLIVTSDTPDVQTDIPLALQDSPDSNAPPQSRTATMGEDVIVGTSLSYHRWGHPIRNATRLALSRP